MPDVSQADVVVVGAGPGGLAAAWAAASHGKKVALIDDNAQAGGQIWRADSESSMPRPAQEWLRKLRGTSCEFFHRYSVVARPSSHELMAESPGGTRRFVFDKLILATGSRELFLPFPGWTLPGVFGLGGLQAFVKSGLSVSGKHIVVAGSGPLLLAVAAYLRKHGAEIMCIAEQAPAIRVYSFGIQLVTRPSKLAQGIALRARLPHVPYDFGWFVSRAEGDEKVTSVTLTNDRRERTYVCDMLACAFGLVPNVEIPMLLGCQLDGDFVKVNRTMETSVPGIFCAGEPTGIGGMDAAIVQGLIAGTAAAGASPAGRHLRARNSWKRFERQLARAFEIRDDLRGEVGDETKVCRCEDVTLRNLKHHDSWRDAKLQTRVGMGPCQGRVCGAACRYLFGWQSGTIRPPVLPAQVGTLIACGDSPANRGPTSVQP
jgi:NADPH-dependent 2,4-dienoyl-CoA reductase/sulfur reductase-like enzyme